jgi:hypothetical protein
MAARKNPPPKGVRPPQLAGKGFDAHPENRNTKGSGPKSARQLRDLIMAMGSEEIEVLVKGMKGKQKVKMTRIERILLEWFETESVKKQELLFNFGFGKPTETIEVVGNKTIHVSIGKKKQGD